MDKGGIYLSERKPIFYSALLLTAVNLLLRFVGTSFQVYISGRLGPAGVGLLQLVLSVGSLAMIASIAGVRTATMYLTAEELGKGRKQNVTWILSGCFAYSILISSLISGAVYIFAPQIAEQWIGDLRTVDALRLFAAFLPVSCLCAVMTGYFTAANRIGTLAVVEIAEQLCAMLLTLAALTFWAGEHPGRACMSVIFGSCAGACLTLCCLLYLRLRERDKPGQKIPVRSRLLHAAVPLALADVLKSGITTTENLIVPKRLALNPRIGNPLAAFGSLSGMVFPVLMFPACILFGLAELLIPELARCTAAGSRSRIQYLVRRSLKASVLYGAMLGGLMFLLAEPLCLRLYDSREAGRYLRLYALLIPMLYCDAITDAMTKGLGQQTACVRYNILTSGMDVLFLYLLLPKYGMEGYFFSFLVTHMINFLLSLRRLLKISGVHIPFYIPAMMVSGILLALTVSGFASNPAMQCICYILFLPAVLYLFRILRTDDALWVRGLVSAKVKS